MAPTTHQCPMPRFPNLLKLLLFLLSTTTTAATALLRQSTAFAAATGFRIPLIHRDSIHSPLYSGNLTNLELHSRLLRYSKAHTLWFKSSLLNLPLDVSIRPIVLFDRYSYFVQMTIGTPRVDTFLILDTGSDITWTQCHPCNPCFEETEPVYYPSRSASQAFVPCNDSLCTKPMRCVENQCVYSVEYLDGTYTKGRLSRETFTFNNKNGDDDILQELGFGCSTRNTFHVENRSKYLSGILAMSRGPQSFAAQLLSLGVTRFSYCLLPPRGNTGSYLRFGNDIPTKWFPSRTPLLSGLRYRLGLNDISVDGRRLKLPKGTFEQRPDGAGGAFIDSGSELTSFIRPAYDAVLKGFADYFYYFRLKRIDRPWDYHLPFDFCYLIAKDFNEFPTMTFHFNGADLVVPPTNLFIRFPEVDCFCLGLLPDDHITLIGAMQQNNFRFIYDLRINQLYFFNEDCAAEG